MVEIITSKTAMTDGYKFSKTYIEGSCLSSDTKPTECATGSIMVEADTGDVYFFNGSTWVRQFSFQG